jgi:hypothetical protein
MRLIMEDCSSEIVLLKLHDVCEFSLVVRGHVVEVLVLFTRTELAIVGWGLYLKELFNRGPEASCVLTVQLYERLRVRVYVH